MRAVWFRHRLPRAALAVAAIACGALAVAAVDGAPDDRRAAVEIEPQTADQRAVALAVAVDVWTESAGPGEPSVIVVTADGRRVLAAIDIPHRVLVDDIDADAAAERARLAHRAQTADWFAEYRDVDEVAAFLDDLAGHHPGLASVRAIGTSIHGRSIRAVEVSRGGPIRIALNGAQHAREWISVMVPACIAERLVKGDATDARIQRILDAVSFTIVPIVNPDGYAHSWTTDRYWRKNRRGRHGVDLNRNYSVAWGGRGSSKNPSSQTYRGEHAFSEPESRAMRDLIAGGGYVAHVDFHSFSQLVLVPWSHTPDDPPDAAEYGAMADRMTSAMFATHGERYKFRRGVDLLYGASGTLTDWVYGTTGAMSFVVELRPPPRRNHNGFVLPPEQIVPTCEENLAAVLELAEWMIAHPRRAP